MVVFPYQNLLGVFRLVREEVLHDSAPGYLLFLALFAALLRT